MAKDRLVPRALMYGFQIDAASRCLQSDACAELPEKLVKRLKTAVQYNAENPLLPVVDEPSSDVGQAGRWWTIWPKENRLRIKGTVQAGCERVGLFVNDRIVKLINTVPRPDDPLERRAFRFNMKADILRKLPRKTVIGVGSEMGYLRHRTGGLTYRDPRLSGDATLFELLSESHFLTKKGRIQRRLDQDNNWKAAALSAYEQFRDYFESAFGYKPFIICGTLLGYHREGDFIAHDDDMDVAFFSNQTSPETVRRELGTIVHRMLCDGFDIKLARKSGFFKPFIDGFSFDVFPMWSDRNCLWMMNTTRQRAGPELILPVETAVFQGTEVYVPREIERYIESEYGPNWRVPDPGYRSVGEPGTSEYLLDSCLTTDEILDLYEDIHRISATRHGVGKLSIADRDIDTLSRS